MENSGAYIIAVSSLVAILFAHVMGLFSWKNHMPVEGKVGKCSQCRLLN